ncbi:class I SAM-dependent methyltransferase [Janibacter cremeus]|uniref:Putative O-methyltransferase YrrM n=1 Tax=Janibacter cremeus TaxID=1285192 RepID=A0A852W015_9MICO|nr:class I SAM-dependent methyltransferase [Janibacter cremeus]NYF99031.1 putative O-methyltransferase YrrM [Janibacter cremeus]
MEGMPGRAVRTARAFAAAVHRPPYVMPGHYYSPTTSLTDRERAVAWRTAPVVGVDLNETGQERLARRLAPLMVQLPEDRWEPNGMYGRADAAVLHGMLRHHEPKHLLEVGSGYSTAVALDVVDRYLPDLRITCVEPNPDRLRTRLRPGDEVVVIDEPVQDVPIEIFAQLGAGDILFIDSTHVLKSGSDVAWLYLHVLPTLSSGVVVHVHDVHWPFEYPERWIREGRDWTEAYLLRAFLTHNDAWQILLMTSWVWGKRPALVPESLRHQPTGSLWMQRR